MTPERFAEITSRFAALRIVVAGDFALDRYLEIDPEREESSIETGLPVHQVMRIRSQPGAAGTIGANLSALGVGTVQVIGFCGSDGEGFELRRALGAMRGVDLSGFVESEQVQTFAYVKPLVCARGVAPVELNRIDMKNWRETPPELEQAILGALEKSAATADALIVMNQVSVPNTGAITARVLQAISALARAQSQLPIIADSRRTLRDFPALIFKMNAAEFEMMSGMAPTPEAVAALAQRNGRAVFVTLAERGILGALPGGGAEHVEAFPVHAPIDIVGAGDAVTANLAAAIAVGATLQEAMQLAMAAASVVLHQLGTTGTASCKQLQAHLTGRIA